MRQANPQPHRLARASGHETPNVTNEPASDHSHDLFDLAERIYRYARRWAVGHSAHAEDALIYDACIAVLNEHCAPLSLGPSSPSATHDRYLRNGAETLANTFTLPITVADAAVILHRFARRYTNGRGSFTASIVNGTARDLVDAGVSLDETRQQDGTHWAADGTDGEHDGLAPDQRAEALGALPAKTVPIEDLSVQ